MKNIIRFCPKCKSINVMIDSEDKLWAATQINGTFICKDCGFKSKIFPEIEKSKLKLLKNENFPENK